MGPRAKAVPMRAARSVALAAAEARQKPKLALDAPAIELMTDLDRTPTVTVAADTPIDDALRLMKNAGVRSAIVIDGNGGLLGLVTAYDILGEKPVRLVESGGREARSRGWAGVPVSAVMEPAAQWQVVDVEDLEQCSVADVVETFRGSGRTHIVVVESTGASSDRLRGLLSATEVTRRTGAEISGLPQAATFADIEQAAQANLLH